MRRYVTRWVELAEIGEDYKKLIDLILREQILASCSPTLVTFLKEHECKTAQDMIDLAERYREAHPKENMAAKGSVDPVLAHVSFHNPSGQGYSGRGLQREAGGDSVRQFVGRSSRGTYTSSGSRTGVTRPVVPPVTTSTTDSAVSTSQKYTVPARRSSDQTQHGVSSTNRGQGIYRGRGRGQGSCYWCGGQGHYIASCPKKVVGSVGLSSTNSLPDQIQTCQGTINGFSATVMLDSGCTTVGVRRNLVREDQLLGRTVSCTLFTGDEVQLPLAKVNLDCPYFSGTVEACVVENPVCDVILGRVQGSNVECIDVAAAVTTRAQKAREDKPFRPLLTAKVPQLDVSPAQLAEMQKADETLKSCFKKLGMPQGSKTLMEGEQFVLRDNLLYRSVVHKKGELSWQLLVPQPLRESVLIAAHDGLFGGHMGSNSTFKRIAPFFHWPGMRKAVKQYCRSCDICQKTFPRGRVPPAPLQSVPSIDIPFSRVVVDLIGPISPVSARGYRYVLTCVDVATRYPEAVPLKTITSEAVADALIHIFSRVGVPDEILSDQGTQFTSDMMRELLRLLSVSQLHGTPYHPQTQGLCERFNGTLKSLLKKMMKDKPTDWDKYLDGVLFACREIPHESTGYSPFELLYGRVPKGPTQLLYQSWTGQMNPKNDQSRSSEKPVSQYVQDLKDLLCETVQRAQESAQEMSQRHRKYKLRKAGVRSLPVGGKTLVLLPSDNNKLLLRWKGPYKVLKKLGNGNYLIEFPNGVHKQFHINLLREYHDRSEFSASILTSIAVVSNSNAENDFEVDKVKVDVVPTVQTESVKDVWYDPSLAEDRKYELHSVFQKHERMMTDLPGEVDLCTHSIKLHTDTVVNVKQYPLPFGTDKIVEEEVDKMLDLGIIEPSSSAFASPVVLVKKKDNSTRFCIDFRELNKATNFDSEPIPDQEALFAALKDKKYFTKIDLAKGYWQIPMAEEDKEKTAFRCSRGLFHFLRMPFGLSTAPSSFARMMRMLKLDRFDAVSFFDDILVASESWSDHLNAIDRLLTELHAHGLTVRPSKVHAGFQALEFLGHIIGDNSMKPVQSKVSKILSVEVPKTKRQVRAFLGMSGFYRRYIPDYSTLVAPLTDLTKKSAPNRLKWTDDCQTAFDRLKRLLSSEPVVSLPDFEKAFTVRSDASSSGIGAVLLQQDEEGYLHPVLYASRKLLDREKRYSTVERECLAVVWAIDHFHRYLFGRHFFVETDHRPLTYLRQSKTANGRLLRWALALQEYSFTVVPISGAANHEADVLSRL